MFIQIDGLTTTAGFLKDIRLEFSPGLTCIIGARGTCKSTIVETIRFAFDCEPSKVKELCSNAQSIEDGPSGTGMILATLRSGIAKCRATAIGRDGHDDISIEREVDSAPSVYKNGIEELADQAVLHLVEIYSQGDLQQIAQTESLRLELIDRPNKAIVMELAQQQTELAKQLSEVGQAIRHKNRDIEARRADVRGLADLKQKLADLQAERPKLSAELDQERRSAMNRNSLLEAVALGVEEIAAVPRKVEQALEVESDFRELVEQLESVGTPASQTLSTAFGELSQVRSEIQRIIAGMSPQQLLDSVAELREDFDKRNRNYYKLRHEQQEVTDSLKKEDGLKNQIEHLTKLQNELDEFERERSQSADERSRLRMQLQSLSDKIHALRQTEVERINEQHGEVVILTLELGVSSDEYATTLEQLLAGSGIRKQDEVAREIASQFRPFDLVDIVEAADAERISTALDRDLRQMTRLISHLMDNPDLYDLESILFDDNLEITLFDHGTPKSISELSKGQMATALLPLILRPAPYPLIFDQPEDDLDNSFIYTSLVQQIQRIKLERQLIFVTHNANIPVLGDADTVIVMEMQSPIKASQPLIGTVEDVKPSILSLLEGGSEAFQLRHERYENLLKDAKTDVARVNNSTHG